MTEIAYGIGRTGVIVQNAHLTYKLSSSDTTQRMGVKIIPSSSNTPHLHLSPLNASGSVWKEGDVWYDNTIHKIMYRGGAAGGNPSIDINQLSGDLVLISTIPSATTINIDATHYTVLYHELQSSGTYTLGTCTNPPALRFTLVFYNSSGGAITFNISSSNGWVTSAASYNILSGQALAIDVSAYYTSKFCIAQTIQPR